MATYYSTQWNSGKAEVGSGPANSLKVLYGTYEIGTALSAADVVKMFVAPAGFTPLFGFLQGDDLDTGTEAIEIDVGITGDSTKYLNSGVITGDVITGIKTLASIWMPLGEDLFTVKPTAFTSDTEVILTFTAAANAGGTGTITLIMVGVYNDARVSR